MNKLHQQRFEAAKSLFQRLVNIPDDYRIYYDGQIIDKKSIRITQDSILVWIDDNFCETWFEVDPSWDHGIYTTISEYEANVRNTFKVIKLMENW